MQDSEPLELVVGKDVKKKDRALAVLAALVLILVLVLFLFGQWVAAAALFIVFIALLLLPWIGDCIEGRKKRIKNERQQ